MKILRVTCCLFVLILSIVAFAFASTASPARAASPAAVHFSFHGLAAFADFDSVSGCVDTFVSVDGTSTRNQNFADVFIGQFDFCTDTDLLIAFGSTSAATFQVGSQFSSATLSATIPVTDELTGNTFNVSVSVNWTATGPIQSEVSTFHFHTKGFTENDQFNAKFRDAQASGTISDGTTNFSPSPSDFAQIGRFNQGDVLIIPHQ